MQNVQLSTGLTIAKKFTLGKNPYEMFSYDLRTSVIRNPDGSVVFELKDIEVPSHWSQVATDILAQKYFRKAGVPQYDKQGNALVDKDGKPLLGSETSVKQVVKRLSGCWRYWGEKHGYFASVQDAQAYEDEMAYMLLSQMAAPNSPQWFNTGLAWAYGINGKSQGHYYFNEQQQKVVLSEDAYTRPQPHACFIQAVHDDLVNKGGIFDLATREARLFKYGSGTGTNFSSLRGRAERLSGGGKSSGLMSWLKIFDRAAGAIKSGGTTRRAAKMVCLDMDHPEIEDFILWKMYEEQKVAGLVTGSQICKKHLDAIISLAQQNADITTNKQLAQAVKQATKDQVPLNYIYRVLQLAKQGKTDFDFPVFDTHYESAAYETVSGQNANNSVRIPNAFMEALQQDKDWQLVARTTGQVVKDVSSRDLWEKICFAAWSCADPGLQYNTTINEWHTCPAGGPIRASNPCSEYMFLDDTACNLASINLVKFLDEQGNFNIPQFEHAVRLWTITLEIAVLMAQFPSEPIAELSYKYRTLGLGYANIGSLFMRLGIAYDSDKARAMCGAITAIMTGRSYETSADLASVLGPFPEYHNNRQSMLRVISNHRLAAYNAPASEYDGLSITPMGIDPKQCPDDLLQSARQAWDLALQKGMRFGYRNAQTTVIAPTGTIGLVMDCDTTGIEPDFALVKFKKLAGGGYFKIVNQSVPPALKQLGYTQPQIHDIVHYCVGHKTLQGCPYINKESLEQKGIPTSVITVIEGQLENAFDLQFVFNKYSLGEEVMSSLGLDEHNVLGSLGFSKQEIEQANEYVCGTMTVEGAPHLRQEHYAVFDCANPCGKKGKRFIGYTAHLYIMAAAQPFISGAISKTINMANDATVNDISDAYMTGWKIMLKAVALYRDGSKLSQPLNTISGESTYIQALLNEDDEVSVEQEQEHVVVHELPAQRHGIVQQASISGHDITIRTGEFSDGSLGEVSVDMYKRGSSYGELMHAFAQSVSLGLQQGVPLEKYVDTFTFTKFEPAGVVSGHPAIKNATSPVDYLFRSLAHTYLGREDLVHVKGVASKQEASKMEYTTMKVVAQKPQTTYDKRSLAKAQGYTGESCSSCGSMKVKQNGTCAICEDCGSTTGCS
ncbi:MAG: adenosylcobalamin-dependent ribonucleoside-diphosphate reductase [Candidatus Woesearchaeota archaeon]